MEKKQRTKQVNVLNPQVNVRGMWTDDLNISVAKFHNASFTN